MPGEIAHLPRDRRRIGRVVAANLPRPSSSTVGTSRRARIPKFRRRSAAKLAVVTIGPAPATSHNTTAVPIAAASSAARALANTRSYDRAFLGAIEQHAGLESRESTVIPARPHASRIAFTCGAPSPESC